MHWWVAWYGCMQDLMEQARAVSSGRMVQFWDLALPARLCNHLGMLPRCLNEGSSALSGCQKGPEQRSKVEVGVAQPGGW